MLSAFAAAVVVACAGGPAESPARPSVPTDSGRTAPPPVVTFGPESLQVAFLRLPDSAAVATDLGVTAVAYNRTRARVVVPFACAASGLSVRVLDARGDARDLPRATCDGGTGAAPNEPNAPNVTTAIAPGDSVVATLTGPAPSEAGAYRVRAGYVTEVGSSAAVERPVRVLYGFNCPNPAPVVPAIQVTVLDAATDSLTRTPSTAVASDGPVSILLASGPWSDDQRVPGYFFGAEERAGTYTVTVSAAGYAPWVRDGVVVAHVAGECHVRPAVLTARLARTP